jgi:ABC-type transport system involved in cytochrome bd biosynthesis fused ATPase/permease subunit
MMMMMMKKKKKMMMMPLCLQVVSCESFGLMLFSGYITPRVTVKPAYRPMVWLNPLAWAFQVRMMMMMIMTMKVESRW